MEWDASVFKRQAKQKSKELKGLAYGSQTSEFHKQLIVKNAFNKKYPIRYWLKKWQLGWTTEDF